MADADAVTLEVGVFDGVIDGLRLIVGLSETLPVIDAVLDKDKEMEEDAVAVDDVDLGMVEFEAELDSSVVGIPDELLGSVPTATSRRAMLELTSVALFSNLEPSSAESILSLSCAMAIALLPVITRAPSGTS